MIIVKFADMSPMMTMLMMQGREVVVAGVSSEAQLSSLLG